MFIQSLMLVTIEHTCFYKLADYVFGKVFTVCIANDSCKVLILIPVWPLFHKWNKNFTENIFFQIAPKTCKIHHYIH